MTRNSAQAKQQLYEAAKAAWSAKHRDATPEQYQVAMRKIAEQLKL
jgi:hypothetical protein